MKFKVEEPPLKKTKRRRNKKNSTSSTSPSLSLLPNEIILSCLGRVSKSQYSSICLVSKSFYSLLSSPDIYAVRSALGATGSRLYVSLRLPNLRKWFNLRETKKGELCLVPIKLSCYAKFNATAVAIGLEIYHIGGAANAKRSKSVLVIDCRNHTWRRGPNLTVPRKNAQSCFLDGKIYVIGGCVERDEAINWGEVLDLKTQTWMPLSTPPSDDGYGFDPHHKVGVVEARLHVFTKNKKYAYDPEEGTWVVQEFGFVGLEEVISITRPWCIIENVIFTHDCGHVKWYNTMSGKWDIVNIVLGLNFANHDSVVKLVNHRGELVIIWDRLIKFQDGGKRKRIWCAVIRLDKGPDHKIWGKVERCNVVTDSVPMSHTLSSCLSFSV